MTERHQDDWIDEGWAKGFFGRLATHIATEQPSISWTTSIDCEQRFSDLLDRELHRDAIVLHQCRIGRAKGYIDHLVIAPSGVWVIDTDPSFGTVERRVNETREQTASRLYVNDRDRTKLAGKMARHADAVRNHLALAAIDTAEVHPAICFTRAEFERQVPPFVVDGTWAIWPSALVEKILRPGALSPDEMTTAATELSGRLRASV